MFHELSLGEIYVAPIVSDGITAALIFLACRWALGRIGLLRRVWHPALFEVSLFLTIVSSLVLLR